MLFGQKRLKTTSLPFSLQSLFKPTQTSFFGSFYLYRKFEQIRNCDQNPKWLVRAFWPKTAKNHFASTLLPITLETTPNIFFRLVLPIQKVSANLKFGPKSKGVSPCFLAKNGKKHFPSTFFISVLKPPQTSFLAPFTYKRRFSTILKFDQNPKGLVHAFWPKTAKNHFASILLPITFKTTPNIISRSFYLYKTI